MNGSTQFMPPPTQAFDKTILVAEPNHRHCQQIETILNESGFLKVYSAEDGEGLRSHLKKFHNDPSNLGLIIFSYPLPDCQIVELCQAFAGEHSEFEIPVIILLESPGKEDPQLQKLEQLKSRGVTLVEKPIRAQEFIPLVQLALAFKHERDRTRAQNETMLTELAEHKILAARLKYLVLHDELTGVSNRRSLEQTLQLAIHHCQSYKQESALFYLDIDRFDVINDIEGHDTGDRLLVELVNLLRQNLPTTSTLARIGADEFCIYLPNTQRDKAVEIAEALRKAVDDFWFMTPNDSYHISVSIGIALLTPARIIDHPNELIAQAHQACYIAKTHGRNLVNIYDAKDMATTHFNDVRWVPLLREGLKNDRFFLVFQPIVRLVDGYISHYEVLLRLKDEQGRMFTPDIFIPAAERMGLIHNLDMWVIEHAIDFLASLPETQSHISLAINLSGHAFQNHQLLPFLEKKLQTTWLSPKRLVFEITETAAIANFEFTRIMIAKLHSLGCCLALDDFGTGFNSFEYIKNFPVDYLKIDGQFVQNLANDETDQVLVNAMVKIAHKLGKQVIAEYVENPQALEFLKKIGVDYGQGYLLGKPVTELLPHNILPLNELLPQGPQNLTLFDHPS